MSDLWWLPSLVIFGSIAVVVIIVVRVTRRSRLASSRRAPSAPLRSGAPVRESIEALSQRANIALVRLDDALETSADELGFAIAQFGEAATAEFAAAVASARADISEAFALKQKLDDAIPDTERDQRDWTTRVLFLAESAKARLDDQESRFGSLRRLERDAPAAAAETAARIRGIRARVPGAIDELRALRTRYAASVTVSINDSIDRANELLDGADSAVAEATAVLATSVISPVNTLLHQAEDQVRRAAHELDAITACAEAVAAAEAARDEMSAAITAAVAEAKLVRDADDTDPATAGEIGDAVQKATAATAAIAGAAAAALSDRLTDGSASTLSLRDPVAELEHLRPIQDLLDTTLATARNRRQRLENARVALVGALAIAKSQIAAAKQVMTSGRRDASAAARTRLAEAERNLAMAAVEADPVVALDTARRANSLAQDADALARYDQL